MSPQLRSASVFLVALTAASGVNPQTILAQPRFPPPPRVSAEVAGRTMGGVTLVSLHFQSAPARDVLQSLAQQAGLGLHDEDVRDVVKAMAPITIAVDKQPFWVAALALTSQLNLRCEIGSTPDFSKSERGWILELKPGRDPALQGPSQVSGPFLIVASSVARVLRLTADAARPSDQQVHVEFMVLIDPKLRPRGRPQGQTIEVLDDQMRALPIVAANNSWARDIQPLSPLVWRLKAVVNLPNGEVQRLGRVQGMLRGLLATTKNEVWEVTDIFGTQNAVKEVGGARFAVRQIIKEAGNFGPEYAVTVASDGVGEETDFGWPPRSDVDRTVSVELLDAQGRRLLPQAWGADKSGGYVIKFLPGPRTGVTADGQPTKLRWELPAEVAELQIPFEFANLPLP